MTSGIERLSMELNRRSWLLTGLLTDGTAVRLDKLNSGFQDLDEVMIAIALPSRGRTFQHVAGPLLLDPSDPSADALVAESLGPLHQPALRQLITLWRTTSAHGALDALWGDQATVRESGLLGWG